MLGQLAVRHRNGPRPHDPGHRRGNRHRRRELCDSGPPVDRHRAATGARGRDLRGRRGSHHDLGGALDLQVAHLSGRGVSPGRQDERAHDPAGRDDAGRGGAPGGAGGLARRRPAVAHRGAPVPGRWLAPHGGDRLVSHGHAGSAGVEHHPRRRRPAGAGARPVGTPAPANRHDLGAGRDQPRGRRRQQQRDHLLAGQRADQHTPARGALSGLQTIDPGPLPEPAAPREGEFPGRPASRAAPRAGQHHTGAPGHAPGRRRPERAEPRGG